MVRVLVKTIEGPELDTSFEDEVSPVTRGVIVKDGEGCVSEAETLDVK